MYPFKLSLLKDMYDEMYHTIEKILEMDDAWIEDAFIAIDPVTLEINYVDGEQIIADDLAGGERYGDLDLYQIFEFTDYNESTDETYILEKHLAETIEQNYYDAAIQLMRLNV